MTNDHFATMQERYAELLIRTGVNLQPGQCLLISAELAHAPFVRLLAAQAYRDGAPYVHVQWVDTGLTRARLLHSQETHLDLYPEFEVARHHQLVDEQWGRLALVGPEFPDLLDDVDTDRLRRVSVVRREKIRFYMQAMMSNRMQWCVAGVPTTAWARQVFPDLAPDAAVERLWQTIFQVCRVDRPDPVTAWAEHDRKLKAISAFMAEKQVRALHFVDTRLDDAGQPLTDLTIGLTDRPRWVAASSVRPDGVDFMANMPTEEVFTTPHNQRTHGYVRTSKPTFPFERRVENATVRFQDGEVVEYHAEIGQDVLDQFFAVEGTRCLGEVALVDVRSPINQLGVIFQEILFDENAVCHIAFGDSYSEGVEGGSQLGEEELRALGANSSNLHVDTMIGTDTMNVTGICADGSRVAIMEQGRFVVP